MLVCVNLCKVTHSIEIEAKMLYRERLYDLRLLCVWGVRAAFERAPIPTLSLSFTRSVSVSLSFTTKYWSSKGARAFECSNVVVMQISIIFVKLITGIFFFFVTNRAGSKIWVIKLFLILIQCILLGFGFVKSCLVIRLGFSCN